ncbi:IS5 family transposase [Flavobacterium psychrophilum]|uniref:IS5 family transposase n=1 Tax=Flavobacterium psychrophilum TaxID=96345 RepID=UPI000B7C32F0|nr:IS5 family transposase [Flavobacterium psychrophilum]SNA76701.1 transposase IS5 family [Flavobacterium psychrophilum]
MKKFKRHRDYGFFDQDIRLTKLSELGDPLEKLNAHIDFEIFRDLLETRLSKIAKGKGGRKPYDYVLMFKILILQRYYNVSDDQIEYQINDRMSFMRFLDLTIADDIPDSKTVWNFREQLIDLKLIDELFQLFLKELELLNFIINEGKIIDASFIEVPKQRNSRAENTQIKSGNTPESFEENSNKKSQKDLDARWTKKNNVSYYGYKNHVKVDAKSKLIVKYEVTDASVHDSQVLEILLDEKDADEDFSGDSAYSGENQRNIISQKEMNDKTCKKGYRNNPLTEQEIATNREKSRIRSRVEHIFGFMEGSMNGMHLYAIGIKRVEGLVGLMNLTYNMFRKIQIQTI